MTDRLNYSRFDFGVKYYDGKVAGWWYDRDYAQEELNSITLRLKEIGIPSEYWPKLVTQECTTTYGKIKEL